MEKDKREAEGNQEKVGSWETKQERVSGRSKKRKLGKHRGHTKEKLEGGC